MQLSEDAINKFKILYKKEYGVDLTNSEAMNYGLNLIRLVKAVYEVKIYDQIDKYKNRKS